MGTHKYLKESISPTTTMTYKMHNVAFGKFPHQLDESRVRHLNEVNGARIFNNDELRDIGREVNRSVIHYLGATTSDGYYWFGGLQYSLKDSQVAILFPWSQDWDHPETQMDRGINVYVEGDPENERIDDLLENVAYQMALYTPGEKGELRQKSDSVAA